MNRLLLCGEIFVYLPFSNVQAPVLSFDSSEKQAQGGFFMGLLRYVMLTGAVLSCCTVLSAKEIAARLNYRICVQDQPAKIETVAAAELASYLERTYTEKIRMNGSDAPILFSVGFASEAKEFNKAKDAFKESGFGVFCRNRTVLLTGFDDSDVKPYNGFEEGTLLSVYYFLRNYTGLKVFAPDPVHGEKLGRNPEIKLASADKPTFSFSVRGMGLAFKDVTVGEMNRYARKQLCHDFYWTNSNLYYTVLFKWGKRFKDKPEMLGLHRGKRQSVKYPYHLPCLTNPEVRNVIVDDILKLIRKHKLEDRAVIRVFCDAPFRRCECENCSKITSNDDYFYGFIVSVRDAVKKSYPNTRLFLQEKGSSHRNPPSTGDLSGVVVDIASGYPEKIDYRKNQPLFRKWRERGAQPTIRHYARYPQWTDCPIINPHDIAKNFRAMKGFAIGQRRSDNSRNIPYAFAALTNYVHVNCLMNADADTDKLIREFCELSYPGAAEEMVAFYNWMEKRQENLGVWDNPYLKCYSYKSLEYPLSLLDAAAKKCRNPFWLNKLRTAFDEFREKAKKLNHLTENLEKNMQIVAQRRAQFKKDFSKPFVFSAEKITFPLCPMTVPLSAIQDSFASVQMKDGRLVIQLTAMEEHPEKLNRAATQDTSYKIWTDDSFEIMIVPENKKFPYLQLAVNANGTVNALLHEESASNQAIKVPATEWKPSANVGKDRWTAEVSVPKSWLRKICPEDKGRFGIFRNRVLVSQDPGMRNFYAASSGLDAQLPTTSNYHDVSRHQKFIIK